MRPSTLLQSGIGEASMEVRRRHVLGAALAAPALLSTSPRNTAAQAARKVIRSVPMTRTSFRWLLSSLSSRIFRNSL